MKKKTKQTPSSSSLIPTPADLKTLISDHSLFFDKLVQLIPAQYYLSTDDDNKPWYQGLSKAAKASAKHQTRENIKKARRARLDPENSQKTTLDILKKKIETTNEEEKVLLKSKALSSSSVTYEELQQRLQAKLVELRSNRGQGKRSVIDRKRRRDDDFDDVEAVGDGSQLVKDEGNVDIDKEVEAAAEGIEFGKLRIDNEVGGRDKKRKKGSKAVELERARKLEEAKKDPEKGEVVAKQHSWKAATSRAMGIKVHDSTKILKESIKKDKKRHEKNASKWKDRVESKEKFSKEKQQKRAGNIAERAKQKKDRKIAKREKKLMRPGFEGRKQGYINGDK
ncbi:ribosomal RNA-processing protein 14-C [Heracleum sosnowskyi]|uniref:Ribosomal RNA-processing protein 14-C n=1 Tax=Heracleum sosnowskyi TaxID=360622 RepID=A0AAD8J7E7_9APIA|nr:ribosomal RNA-processing protein 14-C [Heracleum sosnowskyi]